MQVTSIVAIPLFHSNQYYCSGASKLEVHLCFDFGTKESMLGIETIVAKCSKATEAEKGLLFHDLY